MRIIDDKNNKEKIIYCASCNTKIGYTQDDVLRGADKTYIICPKCGIRITIDSYDRYLEFPKAYHNFSIYENAVDIDNKTIESWVKQGIHNLYWDAKDADNPDDTIGNYWFCGSGNAFVLVRYYPEEEDPYDITIAKNYYNTTITEEDAKNIIEGSN